MGKNKSAGFTLLELLVVVAIIGILLGIVSFAFTTAQKQGRDARRMQDMKETQNALEQYYAQYNVYPTGAVIDTAFQGSRPSDPKDSAPYQYIWTYAQATVYCVCARLERPGNGNANNPTGPICTWASGADYFCVQNQQ